jgi:hypothetical protein
MAMRFNHPLKVIGAAAVILLTAVTSIWLYACPNTALADAEQYHVLSDYITSGLTGDSHDLGSRSGLVVIRGLTSATGRILDILPRARRDLRTNSQWPILNFLVVNLRSVQLRPDLTIPAVYVLANEDEIRGYWDNPLLVQRFARSYSYLTFSRIGFNRQLTEAVFYTEHACGLCGEGKYVYMRKLNGKWFVQSESGTWIS